MERTAYSSRSARGGQRVGRTGICLNTDNCQKAKDKETIVVRTGDFVCPECGNELHEIKEVKKPNNWMLIGGIAAAVIAIIVLIICMLPFGNDVPTKAPKTETHLGVVDSVTTEETETESVTDTVTVTDTITVTVTDTVTVTETKPATPETKTKVKTRNSTTVSSIPVGAIVVEGGYYEGPIRNGVPHGSGIMTYLKSMKIVPSKDYVAQPGETVTGTFRDGKLLTGTWTQKNGNKVRVNR